MSTVPVNFEIISITNHPTNPNQRVVKAGWDSVPQATAYQVQLNYESFLGTPFEQWEDWGTITQGWGSVTVEGTISTPAVVAGQEILRVRAQVGGVWSAWSNWIRVQGGTSTNPPSTPTNFRSTNTTANSVLLAWNAVTGATSYEIRYAVRSASWETPTWTDSGTTATISGLNPSTQWEFQIRARNNAGNSSYSTSIYATTLAGGDPTQPPTSPPPSPPPPTTTPTSPPPTSPTPSTTPPPTTRPPDESPDGERRTYTSQVTIRLEGQNTSIIDCENPTACVTVSGCECPYGMCFDEVLGGCVCEDSHPVWYQAKPEERCESGDEGWCIDEYGCRYPKVFDIKGTTPVEAFFIFSNPDDKDSVLLTWRGMDTIEVYDDISGTSISHPITGYRIIYSINPLLTRARTIFVPPSHTSFLFTDIETGIGRLLEEDETTEEYVRVDEINDSENSVYYFHVEAFTGDCVCPASHPCWDEERKCCHDGKGPEGCCYPDQWSDEMGMCIECCLLGMHWSQVLDNGFCIQVLIRCLRWLQGRIYWDYDNDKTAVTHFEFGQDLHATYPEPGFYKIRVELWDGCMGEENSLVRERNIFICVPVEDIVGVPNLIPHIPSEDGIAGRWEKLVLDATVIPDRASNKNINWSIVKAGGTGARIQDIEFVLVPGEIRFPLTTSTTMRIEWNAVDGVDGYQIHYTPDRDFIQNVTIISVPATLTHYTLTNLPSGVIHFVQVRGFRGSDDSDNSVIHVTSAGTMTIRATIFNGLCNGGDLIRDFEIEVEPRRINDEDINSGRALAIEINRAVGEFHLYTHNLAAYDLIIDWGDNIRERVQGRGGSNESITHKYEDVAGSGNIRIIIAPYRDETSTAAGSTAWLKAFGVADDWVVDSEMRNNQRRIRKVDGKLVPLMVATRQEITENKIGNDAFHGWFTGCDNLEMSDRFGFLNWENITTIGDNFCKKMFALCEGHNFTIGNSFSLIDINEASVVGHQFCSHMFFGCNGNQFNMHPQFNLPQNIVNFGHMAYDRMFSRCNGNEFTMSNGFRLSSLANGNNVNDSGTNGRVESVGHYFCDSMFRDCNGARFNMSSDFRLQILTTNANVGIHFIRSMFQNCYGVDFRVPEYFRFPLLSTTLYPVDPDPEIESDVRSTAFEQVFFVTRRFNVDLDDVQSQLIYNPFVGWSLTSPSAAQRAEYTFQWPIQPDDPQYEIRHRTGSATNLNTHPLETSGNNIITQIIEDPSNRFPMAQNSITERTYTVRGLSNNTHRFQVGTLLPLGWGDNGKRYIQNILNGNPAPQSRTSLFTFCASNHDMSEMRWRDYEIFLDLAGNSVFVCPEIKVKGIEPCNDSFRPPEEL